MPDLASFSALPLLQVFVGGLITLTGVWFMVQAQKDKAKIPSPAPMHEGLQMFFNGPLIQALQCLREASSELNRLNGSTRELVHGQANAAMVLAAIHENDRKVRDEVSAQTQRHTELMNETMSKLDKILDEMQRRNRI